jgi:hypothetical protein
MSKKLQAQIQDIKRLPGKHKRVLLSMASHARNDGTNIWASKDTIGDGAGVSRWTVYRNLEDLLDVGVVVEANSHTCRNPDCNGAYHYMVNGHYTRAYNIDTAVLQNAIQLREKLRSKMQHGQRSKTPKTNVAKCDANQGVTPSVAIGEKTESSALTSGKEVSEQGSPSAEPPALASRETESQPLAGSGSLAEQDQKQNQPQTVQEFWENGGGNNSGYLLGIITPSLTDALVKEQLPLCDRISAFFDEEHTVVYGVPKKHTCLAAEMVLEWNRAHRAGKYATKQDKKLYIRTPKQFLKALESVNGALLNDYLTHEFEQCETCKLHGCGNYVNYVRELERQKVEAAEKAERQRIADEKAAAEEAERQRRLPLCMVEVCEKPYHTKWREQEWHTRGIVTWKLCAEHYDEEQQARDRSGASSYGKPRLEPRKLRPEDVEEEGDDPCAECHQFTHTARCSHNAGAAKAAAVEAV